jgi:hypothetical protein
MAYMKRGKQFLEFLFHHANTFSNEVREQRGFTAVSAIWHDIVFSDMTKNLLYFIA